MLRYLGRLVLKTLLFLSFLLQLFVHQANAGLIPNSWMESLVLIEVQKKGNFEPLGTGFMIGSKGYKVLVTNAHILHSNTDLPLFIRVNKRDPKPSEAMFDRIKIFPMVDPQLKPIFHKKADLAVLYVLIPNDFDLKSVKIGEIDESSFLQQKDVPLGDEVLLIGFPTSIGEIKTIEKEMNIPVIRGGVVSAKFRRNDHELLLIDAPSYWGNSGGPVILRPSLYNVEKESSGNPPPKSQTQPKLIGIVSEMFAVGMEWEVAPQKPFNDSKLEKQKVGSIWHSGLSVVVPTDYLTELLNTLPKVK